MEKKLIPNSTQIPNIITDKIIPRIAEAESKCLLYICRRTFGFHKDRDRISLSQFTDGIKSNSGEQLDYGTGLSRPTVVEGLRNLAGSGIIKVIETTLGNEFELNTELLVDKYVENEVVKKINQLRKLTKRSKETLPKQVKLFNPQKKGKKGNKVIITEQNNKLFSLRNGLNGLRTKMRMPQ
jgi:DNA-binding Lrp family transcriptional regulator